MIHGFGAGFKEGREVGGAGTSVTSTTQSASAKIGNFVGRSVKNLTGALTEIATKIDSAFRGSRSHTVQPATTGQTRKIASGSGDKAPKISPEVRQQLLHKMAKLGKGASDLQRTGLEGKGLEKEYIMEAATDTHLPSSFDRDVQDAVQEWQKSGTKQDFDSWVKTNRDDTWLNFRQAGRGQVEYSVTEEQKASKRVSIEDGVLKKDGVNLTRENDNYQSKSIYAMGSDNQLYVDDSWDGKVHHSGFMAGGVVLSAGEIKVRDGNIMSISDESGHYKPNTNHLLNALRSFDEKGVALSDVLVKAHEFKPKESLKPYEGLKFPEFVKNVRRLDYNEPIQTLLTLEFLEKNGADISKIQVKVQKGKYMSADEFIKNIDALHNTKPVENAKRAFNFLIGKGKLPSDFKTITTPRGTSAAPLLKFLEEEHKIDISKLNIDVKN